MIITIPKSKEDIIKRLIPYKTVFIVGCAACATKCGTGDEESVKNWKTFFESEGKIIKGYAVLDTPCDMRIVKRDMSKSQDVADADVIFVLACGAGLQAIERVIEKPLIAGLDPVFIGTMERLGISHEYCSVCGECIADQTEGLCPVTRCAKSLVNGPCGGAVDGKCEVDLTTDCVWNLIFEKLKKKGMEHSIVDLVVKPRKTAKIRKTESKKKI